MAGKEMAKALRAAKDAKDGGAVGDVADLEQWIIRIGSPRRLGNLADFRAELVRLYKLTCRGEIPVAVGTRLAWFVGEIRKAKLDEEKLALARKSGDMDAPFAGMQILPPPDPVEPPILTGPVAGNAD